MEKSESDGKINVLLIDPEFELYCAELSRQLPGYDIMPFPYVLGDQLERKSSLFRVVVYGGRDRIAENMARLHAQRPDSKLVLFAPKDFDKTTKLEADVVVTIDPNLEEMANAIMLAAGI